MTGRSQFRFIAALLGALVAQALGGALASAAADPAAPTPAAVAALLGSGASASDISAPQWSPDHARILFVWQQPRPAPDDGAATDLWVVRADGSQRTRLSNQADINSAYRSSVSGGMWSPGSRAVAYVTSSAVQHDSQTLRVASLGAGDTDAWSTTGYGRAVTSPAYSPDGQFLVWGQRPFASPAIEDFALQVATGAVHRVRWTQAPSFTTWQWAAECSLAPAPTGLQPGLEGTGPVIAALGGSVPACDYGQERPVLTASDPSAPAPTTPAAATPTSTPADDFGPARPAGALQVPIAERLTPGGRVGPSLAIRSVGKRLALAQRRGLGVHLDVAGAVSLKGWVILPGAAAASMAEDGGGAGARTLARLAVKAPPAGGVTVRLPFDGPAQAALTRFYKVTVIVRFTATDAAGHRTTIQRPVQLTR